MGILMQGTATNNQFFSIGDSLAAGNVGGTAGSADVIPISTLVTLPSFGGVGWDRYDCAFSGQTAAKLLRDPLNQIDFASNVLPKMSPWAPMRIVSVWCGTNDWAQGVSNAQTLQNIIDLCKLARKYAKVIVIGMIDRNGTNTLGVSGTQCKNYLRQEMAGYGDPTHVWSNYADAFVDVGYMAGLGADQSGTYPTGGGCNDGTIFEPTGTHIYATGFNEIVHGVPGYDINSGINSILSSATAYNYNTICQKDVLDIVTAGL